MAPSAGIGVSVTPSRYWGATVEAIEQFSSLDQRVTVTAVADMITATVTTAQARLRVARHVNWYIADVGDHTMSATARHIRDRRYRISEAGGWHTSTESCRPSRKAPRTVLSRTAASGQITTGAFSQQLSAIVNAPAVSHVQIAATPAGAVGLSTTSTVITAAISSGPIGDTAQIVVLPVNLAAALAILIADEPADQPLTVTVDATKMTVAATSAETTVSITARTFEPAVPWPTPPNPDLERHDLIVTDLSTWHELADHPVTERPFPTSHLRWNANSGTLSVLSRIGSSTIDLDLPATSSDRFAVDLPWPALKALLAGATDARQVGLRYFAPNPTLTFLTADFRLGELSGFATVGARRPDNRLNGGVSSTGH